MFKSTTKMYTCYYNTCSYTSITDIGTYMYTLKNIHNYYVDIIEAVKVYTAAYNRYRSSIGAMYSG